MEVTLLRSTELPPGTLVVPSELGLPHGASLRFGSRTESPTWTPGSPDGELLLGSDLWDRLAIPYEGIRLELRCHNDTEFELGPAVGVLTLGWPDDLSQSQINYRMKFCFDHVVGTAGLYAVGFARTIDWDKGTLEGFVVDNRLGSRGAPVRARLPIPSAMRLAPGISGKIARRLKEEAGCRVFNGVRSLDKHLFHTLLTADPTLSDHLPETRLLLGGADIAAMMTRHRTVFVKRVKGSRGRGIARIERTEGGFEVRHIERGWMVRSMAPDLDTLIAQVRKIVGRRRCIVQQGVNTADSRGRAAHFRIVLAKDRQGNWYCPVTEALAARDRELVITNFANGGEDGPLADFLHERHNLSREQAAMCEAEMIRLCLDAAKRLDTALYPLGHLGFDLCRELDTGHLWLFEANTVPGWGYPDEVEQPIAQSLTDYALCLAERKERMP